MPPAGARSTWCESLRLDFCLSRDMIEEPVDRMVEFSHHPAYRSRFRSICCRRELRSRMERSSRWLRSF